MIRSTVGRDDGNLSSNSCKGAANNSGNGFDETNLFKDKFFPLEKLNYTLLDLEGKFPINNGEGEVLTFVKQQLIELNDAKAAQT